MWLEFNSHVLIGWHLFDSFYLKPYNVDDGLQAFDATNFIIAQGIMVWDMLWEGFEDKLWEYMTDVMVFKFVCSIHQMHF